LPGTEIAFPDGIEVAYRSFLGWRYQKATHHTAIFRQLNKQIVSIHHDALEFPDGHTILLTSLPEHQLATVLQLPAQPETAVEAEAQKRVDYVG
jgi:hypothetical protein